MVWRTSPRLGVKARSNRHATHRNDPGSTGPAPRPRVAGDLPPAREVRAHPQLADLRTRLHNAQPGDRILDIGCGPADVLAELPDGIDYVGFDQSEHYIDSARQRHGARGQFFPGIVDLALVDRLGAASFDIVIAHGLLHHLDDREATEFFSLARAALRPGGRLVTADGCYLAGQSRIARLLLQMDRGRHVRTEAEYVALASQSFAAPAAFVRHDSAYVPYTQVYLVCQA